MNKYKIINSVYSQEKQLFLVFQFFKDNYCHKCDIQKNNTHPNNIDDGVQQWIFNFEKNIICYK